MKDEETATKIVAYSALAVVIIFIISIILFA